MAAQKIHIRMPDKNARVKRPVASSSPASSRNNQQETNPYANWTPNQRKALLQKVVLARQTIGDALDQSRNVADESDQLAILKEGFLEATQQIPDRLKRNPKLYIRNVYDFQEDVMSRLSINANGADNKQYEALMRKMLNEIHTFENYAVRSGVSYVDDLVVLNKDSHILYPDVAHMRMYIAPYRDYLQKMYEQLRPRMDV